MSSLKAPVEEVGDGFSKKKRRRHCQTRRMMIKAASSHLPPTLRERDSAVGSTALAGKILHQFFFFKEGGEESPGSGKRLKAFLCRERYLFMNINCFFFMKNSFPKICFVVFLTFFFSAGISFHLSGIEKKRTEI